MKQGLNNLITHIVALLFSFGAAAQTYSVTGSLVDSKDNSSLIEVTTLLTAADDSTNRSGTVTDINGRFVFNNIKPGKYRLKTIYVGYQSITQYVVITSDNVNLGVIKMKTGANALENVTIKGTQIRATQLGDTSQFNADAYKTHRDATAEDLVTKMPGVTSDNNGVKVNGESVQQVYVDGKPFFGTDPTLALRNLPSEVIDKIQVFDKLSDQAQFTGFDDGSSQKTINIVTKKNRSNGQFGKIYGGYGTDDRYLAGGSLNYFDGNRRVSLIELSNNINQQNFSSQDILGITGGSGSNRGGRGGGGGGGSSTNNFLVGPQGGNTKTHSVGVNYSDVWGKKIKVTGSYFFNSTDNITNTQLNRNYFTNATDSTLLYGEHDYSETKNLNHRINFRFEYTIDSFNSLIITPNISFQNNNSYSTQVDTSTSQKDGIPAAIIAANNTSRSNYAGYNFSNNILFQHKFAKPRRTISINVNTSVNEKTGSGKYYLVNGNLDSAASIHPLDEQYSLYNNTATYSGSINYTEPISKKGQLMFSYNPSYTLSRSDKETYNLNAVTEQYTDHDTLLSNKYNTTYMIQKGGVSYRMGNRKINFSVGVNYQNATLTGNQYFPYDSTTSPKPYESILPNVFFNYRFVDGRNLRIMYRTNTTAPSISQLQNVVDISNPLLLKTGNEHLRQDYEHTLIVRYGQAKAKNGHTFFIFLFANYIDNYIANATYLFRRDSTFSDGIKINKGSQLSQPVNLNGYWNNRAFVTYGIPANFIKSNINLNGGISYTRNPGIISGVESFSNNYAPTAGVVVSSNVSENLDFTFAYIGNYNFVNNTLQSQATNNYYNHTLSFKVNWTFFKGIVFNSNIAQTYYSTLTNTSGNENYILWTSYLGYKFLKKRSLEARITAYDMLNQNKSISRTVTDTYVENSATQVLKQYFMFSLTYTLRNFKGAIPEQQKSNRDEGPHMHGDGPPPGGMPGGPPPGGGFGN